MKLAIIGSYGHVSVALNDPQAAGVEIVAAAKWGEDDPMRFVGKFPSAPDDLPVYDDYRKMLAEVQPDIAAVFMPLYRNAEASIAAAQAGCHIISEKPLATELADLAALRQAVQAAGVQISGAFTSRAEPGFQAVRNVVRYLRGENLWSIVDDGAGRRSAAEEHGGFDHEKITKASQSHVLKKGV